MQLRSVYISAVVGMLAAGCGDNASPECKTLDIYQFGEPQLLALRTGDEWSPLAREVPDGPIRVCLDDDDEYALVSVCITDGKPLVQQVFATVAERSRLFFGTCNPGPFEGELVTITGRVEQSGNVWVGDSSGSSGTYSRASEWMFELSARPRREHVLISSDYEGSFNGASRIAIRRGLIFDHDTTVDDIDLMSEGEPLAIIDAVIAGTRSDETFHSNTYLQLDHGSAEISESRDARARFVPNLQPGEEQYASIFTFADVTEELTASRSVTTMTPDFSTVELLPRLDDVIRLGSDGRSSSWDELPVAEYNELSLFSSSLDYRLSVSATKRWIERHQLTALEADASPPGFDPTWLPTETKSLSFDLVRETDEVGSYTGLSRFVANNPSLRDQARSDVQQMRRRRMR